MGHGRRERGLTSAQNTVLAGFQSHNVTELPYFSVMEFGGGPPREYAMRCLPQADAHGVGADGRRAGAVRRAQESAPDQMGPVAIQRCNTAAAGAELLWVRVFVFAARRPCAPPRVPPLC